MEIKGALISRLPDQTGTSAKGAWIKREFVIETQGQYPKPLKFEVWGDKGDHLKTFKKGNMLTVQFDLDGRESNGKYYVSLRAFKIEADVDTPAPAKARTATSPHRQPERAETERAWENDDDQGGLPF